MEILSPICRPKRAEVVSLTYFLALFHKKRQSDKHTFLSRISLNELLGGIAVLFGDPFSSKHEEVLGHIRCLCLNISLKSHSEKLIKTERQEAQMAPSKATGERSQMMRIMAMQGRAKLRLTLLYAILRLKATELV